MLTLYHDSHTLWSENFTKGKCDLLSETFLDLETASKHFRNAGEFGETEDLAVGDIPNVHLSEERHKVVLAERVDFDVADDDYVVVSKEVVVIMG